MGEITKIQWCDHTFNPVRGCSKVSPGCANCYAEKLVVHRLGGEWGPRGHRDIAAESKWREPLRWNRKAEKTRRCMECGRVGFPDVQQGGMLHGQWGCPNCDAHESHLETVRPRVFCASLADWLDERWPTAVRIRLLDLIRTTPNLDWLLLTKRPENFRKLVGDFRDHAASTDLQKWVYDWLHGEVPANVWLGTSVEDQLRANERVPELLNTPARVRFLSMEPLLGPVDLTGIVYDDVQGHTDALRGVTFCDGRNSPIEHAALDWVILGGESGPGARECCIDYIDDIVGQCVGADVPVFVKQLGAVPYTTNANLYDWPDDVTLEAHGTEAAGARVVLRDKKGGDMAEWPEQLQVRQFPNFE